MSWSDLDGDQLTGTVNCTVLESFYNGVKVPGAWEKRDKKHA
jgi:hypothetical protein